MRRLGIGKAHDAEGTCLRAPSRTDSGTMWRRDAKHATGVIHDDCCFDCPSRRARHQEKRREGVNVQGLGLSTQVRC